MTSADPLMSSEGRGSVPIQLMALEPLHSHETFAFYSVSFFPDSELSKRDMVSISLHSLSAQ